MPDTMGGVPTNIRDLMINPFDRRSPFEKEYDQMIKNKENREKRDEAMSSFATGAPIDNVTLREQDLKRDKRGRAFMNLLDTNENVRTLMGEKMPQFVNQYGGAYNPLAANINQKMIPNLGYVGSMSPELADAYDRRQQSAPMDYRSARMSMVGQDPNMMYY